MHWSVGMLLHDICVFSFTREFKKNETWMKKIGCVGDGRFPSFLFFILSFFCQHGAVDPDDIPFHFFVLQSISLLSRKAVKLYPILSYYGSAMKLLLLFAAIIFPYTYVYKYIHMYV